MDRNEKMQTYTNKTYRQKYTNRNKHRQNTVNLLLHAIVTINVRPIYVTVTFF